MVTRSRITWSWLLEPHFRSKKKPHPRLPRSLHDCTVVSLTVKFMLIVYSVHAMRGFEPERIVPDSSCRPPPFHDFPGFRHLGGLEKSTAFRCRLARCLRACCRAFKNFNSWALLILFVRFEFLTLRVSSQGRSESNFRVCLFAKAK